MNKLVELYNKIPPDKLGHLNLGLLLGLAFGSRVLLAILVITGVAVGKELYDFVYNKVTKTETHHVEALDAVSTMVGGTIGIGVVVLMHLL